MSVFQEVPLFGSFDASRTPFMIMAYANSAYGIKWEDNEDVPQSFPAWYILTNITYPLNGSNYTEAVFTPFYNTTTPYVSETHSPASDTARFAEAAQPGSVSGSCGYNSSSTLSFPDWMKVPQASTIDSIRPSVMLLKDKNTIIEYGTQKIFTAVKGNRTINAPFDAMVFVGDATAFQDHGKVIGSSFNFFAQLGQDKVFENGTLLYTGYPYHLSISGAESPDGKPVSPFRNFLQTIGCAIEHTTTAGNLVNYSTLEYNPGDTRSSVNFPGAQYSGNASHFSAGPQFNFPSEVVSSDLSNLDKSVQFYLIPTQYYVNGGASCFLQGADTESIGNPDQIMNGVVKSIYNQVPVNCTPLQSSCLFGDSNMCSLNIWPSYCLAEGTSCGTCFGGCINTDTDEDYCRISSLQGFDPKKPFVCGENPNPGPDNPPTPPEPWIERSKDWIVGGAILVGIIFIFIILLSAVVASKK